MPQTTVVENSNQHENHVVGEKEWLRPGLIRGAKTAQLASGGQLLDTTTKGRGMQALTLVVFIKQT